MPVRVGHDLLVLLTPLLGVITLGEWPRAADSGCVCASIVSFVTLNDELLTKIGYF